MPPKITIRRKTTVTEPLPQTNTQQTSDRLGDVLSSMNLTSSQVQKLTSLEYPDRTKILNSRNPSLVIEVINMIKKTSFDEVITYLKSVSNKRQVVLDSPLLAPERARTEIQLENLQKTIEAESSEYKCSGCGSDRTISRQKQIRSGDEGSSTLVRCLDCGKGWRID